MILYSPPTIWSLLRGAAINILLPFVNGLMLGFGELLAHEAAFRLGWSGTKVCLADSYMRSFFFVDVETGDIETGGLWFAVFGFRHCESLAGVGLI